MLLLMLTAMSMRIHNRKTYLARQIYKRQFFFLTILQTT
jgi:hypothetical protein